VYLKFWGVWLIKKRWVNCFDRGPLNRNRNRKERNIKVRAAKSIEETQKRKGKTTSAVHRYAGPINFIASLKTHSRGDNLSEGVGFEGELRTEGSSLCDQGTFRKRHEGKLKDQDNLNSRVF